MNKSEQEPNLHPKWCSLPPPPQKNYLPQSVIRNKISKVNSYWKNCITSIHSIISGNFGFLCAPSLVTDAKILGTKSQFFKKWDREGMWTLSPYAPAHFKPKPTYWTRTWHETYLHCLGKTHSRIYFLLTWFTDTPALISIHRNGWEDRASSFQFPTQQRKLKCP